ncbi:MAG: hypothetical protein V1820_05130 [archaeon]
MPAPKSTKQQMINRSILEFEPLGETLGETLGEFIEPEEEPQKKEQVLLLWRDLSMELVKIDLATVRANLDRLS